MRALIRFVCSSRKSRRVPLLDALCGVGAECTENDCDGQKRMRHNMGLCCMNGQVRGRGLNSRWRRARKGVRLRVLRNFIEIV
jgi:hypothetical protein